ncbi:glycosyltransferase [Neomegalonema sp.]|uniref:glycosyltransferase n=1 Tax=Neomegalonema sp. TaxID=2039713 RepID=UPI0026299D04|nr:glycosyltransferase [Neomegalonema sp.]MDD2869437.1 glycosyltransferase [Neomegalonema sp.]
MRELATLWIGERLNDIEIASLWSFASQGQKVKLYAYGPVAGTPRGVEIADAGEILSGDPIVRHKKTGSPAIHADLFRYAMIARTGAVWVDLDMIALKPFVFSSDYVCGFERPDSVNNAVLGLPQDSPTLKALCALRPDTRGLPEGLQGLRRLRYQAKNLLAGGLPISRWPWGDTGPAILTRELIRNGEDRHVLPRDAFYGVGIEDLARFAEPGRLDRASFPDQAYGAHLWASQLRRHLTQHHDGRFPPGSFVATLLDEARRDGFTS